MVPTDELTMVLMMLVRQGPGEIESGTIVLLDVDGKEVMP